MQHLVEKKLSAMHYAGEDNKVKPRTIKVVCATLMVAVLPYLHMGIAAEWVWPAKPKVDRFACTCPCFDTIFRGQYETQPSGYKHIYFNSTEQTLKIWLMTICVIVAAYECFKHVMHLLLDHNMRYTMLTLLFLSIYPHYYSWWNYLNYYNEDFYDQWYHQLYFTMTELISTCFVIYMCKRSVKPNTFTLLVVFSINLSHIIISGVDQFIDNIIYGNGWKHQVARDLGLMIPDIIGVIISIYEMNCLAKLDRTTLKNLFYKEELMFSFVMISLMILLGKNL